MSLTGTLGIDIHVNNGKAISVAFTPARQVDASRLFAGKPWPEAAKIGRLIFAICGNSHAIAIASAAQAAQGSKANDASLLARSILTCAEALREHASRIFMDWPQFLGEAQHVDTMLEVVRSYTALQTSLDLDAILRGSFTDIAPVLKAAAKFAQVVRGAVHSADFLVAENLIERCTPNSGPTAVEADGTVLGRRDHDARLTGTGLERRIRARLLEVDLICDWLENTGQPSPLELRAEKSGDYTGIAKVEVARGLLHHEIRLDGEIVADCTITAPTSANFMQGGAAEKAVLGLDSTNRTQFEWQARLALLEVDPCVSHEVRFG